MIHPEKLLLKQNTSNQSKLNHIEHLGSIRNYTGFWKSSYCILKPQIYGAY